MLSRKTSLLVLSVAVLGGTAATAGAARPAPLAWTTPYKLGPWAGGEPSVAFDPSGNGSVYIVAPQGIPSGAGVLLNALGSPSGTKGIGFWASHDHGRTFPFNANVGSAVGGGDSDVDVAPDHSVYVTDLEAAATTICRSTDGGRSFADASPVNLGCASVSTNQSGPDNDRQWLNHSGGREGVEYLTYHDFAANVPLIYSSTDHGQTFVPCGNILGTGPGATNFLPAVGGDLVAKPVVDPHDGSIYVGVTEPDQQAAISSPQHYPLGNLYIAVARGGCTGTTQFQTHTVYANPGADLAKDFDAIAEDGAGNLYMVATGKLTATQKANAVYVFTSRDHGTTWSKPQQVSARNLGADAMPAIAGGPKAGQVAVGWFGSATSNDENNTKNQWRFYVATSSTFGRAWTQSTVTKSVIHYGDICTQGIMCGLNPTGVGPYSSGNRNLADFSSLAYDPKTGKLLAVFPGDPENRPDLPKGKNNFGSHTYVASQR
jgi:hypothetical protein